MPGTVPVDPAFREALVDYAIRTVWAALVVALGYVLARAVRGTSMRALARQRAHPNVTVLLGNLVQLAVLLGALLVVLAIYTQGAFGWILTSFSVIGLVVGLSLQDILKNFFSGMYILVERPFRIGDTVEVGGYTGVVQEISFRTTQLRTVDGREVVVPNATLMTSAVVNLTRYPTRRASVVVLVPTEEAGPDLEERLRGALAGVAGISGEPPPTAQLRSLSAGKARYELTVWAPDREAAIAAALGAIRARFPQWEIRDAQL